MRPGGACTACPGFSLSSSTTAHSRPARAQSLHSRHRGRTEPRNRARVHEYRQAPPQATEPPTGRKAGNARKSPGQPHRATQRRRGYSHTTTAGKAPQSRPQRRTGASNPQPREQYRRKRPQMPHRAARGGGAIPILPAAKTPHRGAQSRPQRASRRGCKNARNAAALAPACFTTLKR